MLLYKSACYDSFRCLASGCPDTCCQEWDIQVDPETAAYYHTLPGPLGDKVRAALKQEDGETIIALQDNHCPMQSPEGLCSLQSALGEKALCRVCREFPRLHHDYGSFMELGLELSCPEAARLLLTAPYAPPVIQEIPGGAEPDYDEEAMDLLFSSRKYAFSLLSRETRPAGEDLALLFLYSCHVQQLLDGGEDCDFDAAASLQTACDMAEPGDLAGICDFFRQLEILTPEWEALLKKAVFKGLHPMVRNLCRSLMGRYWLQAVSDYDLYCRVKFILVSCILISSLPGDFIWNTHLFSKEIENDIDNVDAILDAVYTEPIFTDRQILGFLLGKC